jgi:hypothetical protein
VIRGDSLEKNSIFRFREKGRIPLGSCEEIGHFIEAGRNYPHLAACWIGLAEFHHCRIVCSLWVAAWRKGRGGSWSISFRGCILFLLAVFSINYQGCVLLSLCAAWEVGGRCCGRSLWLAA